MGTHASSEAPVAEPTHAPSKAAEPTHAPSEAPVAEHTHAPSEAPKEEEEEEEPEEEEPEEEEPEEETDDRVGEQSQPLPVPCESDSGTSTFCPGKLPATVAKVHLEPGCILLSVNDLTTINENPKY